MRSLLEEPETTCVHDHETTTFDIQDFPPHKNDMHTNI